MDFPPAIYTRISGGFFGRAGNGERRCADGDDLPGAEMVRRRERRRVTSRELLVPQWSLARHQFDHNALGTLGAYRPLTLCLCLYTPNDFKGLSTAQCSINTTERSVPEIQTPYLCLKRRKGGESRLELTYMITIVLKSPSLSMTVQATPTTTGSHQPAPRVGFRLTGAQGQLIDIAVRM